MCTNAITEDEQLSKAALFSRYVEALPRAASKAQDVQQLMALLAALLGEVRLVVGWDPATHQALFRCALPCSGGVAIANNDVQNEGLFFFLFMCTVPWIMLVDVSCIIIGHHAVMVNGQSTVVNAGMLGALCRSSTFSTVTTQHQQPSRCAAKCCTPSERCCWAAL